MLGSLKMYAVINDLILFELLQFYCVGTRASVNSWLSSREIVRAHVFRLAALKVMIVLYICGDVEDF